MDFFEVLETLINDCGVPEAKRKDMLAVIALMKKRNAFGISGSVEVQAHDCMPERRTGLCVHCLKPMQDPEPQTIMRRWY